jgi:signal transduction histidine kinase
MRLSATSDQRPRYRHLQILVKDRPIVLRYVVAAGAVATAFGVAALLPRQADPSHFTLFFVAVMLSAWYGGYGAGFAATILSALTLDYFFIAPIHSIELDWHAFLRLVVFLTVASVTSYLTAARKRAEEGLRQARAELENRVRERTAELNQANDALREEIKERQRVEEELLRLQLEIGHVEQFATLGRMSAMIAHDLGTPLNSVLGYTQLIAREQLPEPARRRLSIIETQVHRMVELIQRYLSHTRGSPSRDKIQIESLVRDTVLLLQPVFQRRGVRVITEPGDTLPTLYGEGTSIQRVLINLLDNAADACERGGRIEIRTYETTVKTDNRHGVTIEIADTGAGIAAEMLPRIFDLFITNKPSGKGTGLGLVVCQEIVKAHGGTIGISSRVGQGTTVSVYLPVEVGMEESPATED